MRFLLLTALLLAPATAHADVVSDARSATGACLSAVIDGAPVADVEIGAVAIRRGVDPVSCTVTISEGAPVVVREAIDAVIAGRVELFRPALTRWDPEGFAKREAYCNLSVRRHLSAVVSTAKPGLQPVAVVTVFEGHARDDRCDRDLGLQTAVAGEAATPPASDAIKTVTVQPKVKPRGWRLPRLPGLSKRS